MDQYYLWGLRTSYIFPLPNPALSLCCIQLLILLSANLFQAVADFYRDTFDNSTGRLPQNTLDLSRSLTPLFDFSRHYVDIQNSVDCELDSEEVETLAELLGCHDSELGLQSSHPVKNQKIGSTQGLEWIEKGSFVWTSTQLTPSLIKCST